MDFSDLLFYVVQLHRNANILSIDTKQFTHCLVLISGYEHRNMNLLSYFSGAPSVVNVIGTITSLYTNFVVLQFQIS